MNEHEEAIKIFDEIIDHEFERGIGPSESLIIALRTKIISLRRMKKLSIAKTAVDDVMKKLNKYPGLATIKAEVLELKESEFPS